jgi:hypothetical protein
MKIINVLICGLIGGSALTAFAEELPTLAIVRAEATPSLVANFTWGGGENKPVSADNPAGLDGQWQGQVKMKNKQCVEVVTFTRSPEGNLQAKMENITLHHKIASRSVVIEGNHLKVAFNHVEAIYEGDIDYARKRISGIYSFPNSRQPLQLDYVGPTATSEEAGLAPKPASPLDDVTHAIDVQIADRFSVGRIFNVMEDAELKQAVPQTDGATYNFAKPNTVERCKNAGITYILLTTLEEFQDQDIDLSRGTTQTYDAKRKSDSQLHVQAARDGTQSSLNANATHTGSFSAVAHQTAPEVRRQQIVRLTVRCRLVDCNSGEVLESATHNFNTNRIYSVVAYGKNDVATSDFIQGAARDVADWTVVRVADAAFPIKVLQINDPEILINRGLGAGLQKNQAFDVFVLGDAVKDPQTGEVLGHDETTVGRVTISELHPKFSKARIIENKGIVIGAICRRVGGR